MKLVERIIIKRTDEKWKAFDKIAYLLIGRIW